MLMEKKSTIILYGSYGYTGKLIATECKNKNLNVILSGRNLDALRKQEQETGYAYQVVEANDPTGLRALLQRGKVVINCAGPFQFTSRSMVEACLKTNTHYTDITGEYQVFEMLTSYDAQGKDAGITILPGTGFDVVPSDCLALHLKQRLPSATHLQLAFSMSKGGVSRGTSKTMVEGLGHGSIIRQDGKLLSIPLGKKIIKVDFNGYETRALNIPWGDVSTAWRSTAIRNIEVYMAAAEKMIIAAKSTKYFNWLLRQQWIKNFLHRKIELQPTGPSSEKLIKGKSFLWGKAWDNQGQVKISTIETLSGYALTAKTSVLIAQKILEDNYKTGYQTPATAYGADFILEIQPISRVDK
jgi:short subunit dehydrogenase-like uncharacterized protein